MASNTLRERECWVALSALPGIGARRFYMLLDHFGTAQGAWNASDQDWDGVAGLSRNGWLRTLLARRKGKPEDLLKRISQGSIQALTLLDENYPSLLRNVPDPPPVLFVRGKLLPEDQKAIAIVGTRNASAYGAKVCSQLSRDLARRGITVVSGLARGIDGIAHRQALESGGRTIAVLASGVDIIYPPEHHRLAEQIVERGALVSEYPPGKPPEPGQFPARNRIISGLTTGVIVVEAGEKSGALITADQALEQGREVFAVPGPITQRQSAGPHRLIQQGAKLIVSIDDVLNEVPEQLSLPIGDMDEERTPVTSPEERIFFQLDWEPKSVDQLVEQTGLTGSEVASVLTLLELKGMAKAVPGGRFVAV
ncbi:DNA-protecting protein DprA [Heliobacillus mobilis]|uniref:DNA-protecting protein DprA n=1 Tax=Heliobacterium mobile TaxID=28064 RepID=A0A6I3SC88_HELMO|nr:DNA-processing protein DprA [Heliobacterium mobile]MTV47783.1 DNA-protecting protein DprA [Heliobacterium mobile]